jgi:hypothetical protein
MYLFHTVNHLVFIDKSKLLKLLLLKSILCYEVLFQFTFLKCLGKLMTLSNIWALHMVSERLSSKSGA